MDLVAIIFAYLRFLAFFFSFPLFSMRGVPRYVLIGFAGLLAIAVQPSMPDITLYTFWSWVFLSIQEIAIGLVLSFMVTLVFGIIYLAGQLTDVPLGFGAATVFNPQSGSQVPVYSQFYHILGTLVFLAVDGHLWTIKALSESYVYLPINSFFDHDLMTNNILTLSGQLFSLGLQIALPVIGSILLTDIALGIVSRTVPQINIFVVGFPLKIIVGTVIMVFAIPAYIQLAAYLFAYDGLLLQAIYGLFMRS